MNSRGSQQQDKNEGMIVRFFRYLIGPSDSPDPRSLKSSQTGSRSYKSYRDTSRIKGYVGSSQSQSRDYSQSGDRFQKYLRKSLESLKKPRISKPLLEACIKAFASKCIYKPALHMLLLWLVQNKQ